MNTYQRLLPDNVSPGLGEIQSCIVLNFRSNTDEEEIEQKVYSYYNESLIHFFIDLKRLGEYSVNLAKSQQIFTSTKSTTETFEEGVKYVQSKQ